MTAAPELLDTGTYVLDSAWHAERERLDSITRLYDPKRSSSASSSG